MIRVLVILLALIAFSFTRWPVSWLRKSFLARVSDLEQRNPECRDKFATLVVLGAGLTDTGDLPEPGKDRVQAAVEFVSTHPNVKTVIFSGGPTLAGSTVTEAQVGERYFRQLIPRPAVELKQENKSHSTYENARLTAELVGDDKQIILVTSLFHLPRAVAVFDKQGYTVCAVSTTDPARQSDVPLISRLHALRTIMLLYELAGRAVYAIEGKI